MKDFDYMPLNLFFFQIQITNMDSKLNSILVNHAFYGASPIFSAFHYLMVKKQFLFQHEYGVKEF
jgi:hypothetical protein